MHGGFHIVNISDTVSQNSPHSCHVFHCTIHTDFVLQLVLSHSKIVSSVCFDLCAGFIKALFTEDNCLLLLKTMLIFPK